MVGASGRTHEDGNKKSPWEIQSDFDSILQTLVVEVETILNDSPITYVSSELDDLQPLTPFHLLQSRQIMSLPHEQISERELDDPTYGDSSDVTQRAWLQAALLSQFWSRWRHDYLTYLREYHRASGHNTQQVEQGDVVLVHDDSLRMSWKLVVIEELLKGKDGLVWAANIRMVHGRTNRPIARLIPLEVVSASAGSDNDTDTMSKVPNSNTTEEAGSPKQRGAEIESDVGPRNWWHPGGCHGLTVT